jgi:hypothetical protein
MIQGVIAAGSGTHDAMSEAQDSLDHQEEEINSCLQQALKLLLENDTGKMIQELVYMNLDKSLGTGVHNGGTSALDRPRQDSWKELMLEWAAHVYKCMCLEVTSTLWRTPETSMGAGPSSTGLMAAEPTSSRAQLSHPATSDSAKGLPSSTSGTLSATDRLPGLQLASEDATSPKAAMAGKQRPTLADLVNMGILTVAPPPTRFENEVSDEPLAVVVDRLKAPQMTKKCLTRLVSALEYEGPIRYWVEHSGP